MESHPLQDTTLMTSGNLIYLIRMQRSNLYCKVAECAEIAFEDFIPRDTLNVAHQWYTTHPPIDRTLLDFTDMGMAFLFVYPVKL